MKTKFFSLLTIVFITIFMFGCSNDDDIPKNVTGELYVKVTDAPSDDANIKGTFVTVSKIKVDGEIIEGFEKQTIDVSAYQNGETKLIFADNVEAKNYGEITLELDYETDASGNSPGCYVLTADDKKHDLSNTASMSTEITFNSNFEVQESGRSTIVFDFDLRKTIQRNEQNNETDYSFVTNAEMQSGIRVVQEEETGTVEGDVTVNSITEHEYVIYAYKKGEFNSVVETQGQGEGDIRFANAVTSSKVSEDGSYTLSFLESGDYEIHIATYDKGSNENKITFSGMATAASTISNLFMNNISVNADTSVQLNIEISISI